MRFIQLPTLPEILKSCHNINIKSHPIINKKPNQTFYFWFVIIPNIQFEFMQRQTRKNNQLELLQLQFANHCATIIQSHFKGYIQRKRYRLFLPAYRRFREILLAGF